MMGGGDAAAALAFCWGWQLTGSQAWHM
jgi:hypothetical protein